MRRKLWVFAGLIVALHLVQELFLGVTPLGAFIANSLQILAAVLAAAMCFAAGRRGTGFTRLFWPLIACGFLVWAVGNSGWVYYESFLRIEPPRDSIVHFLVDTRSLFLVMALLLDQNEESAHFDVTPVLDFLQLTIIYALIYLGWYYVPSLSATHQISLWRSAEIEIGEDLAVIALAFAQVARARTRPIRRLYLVFAGYVALLTVGPALTDYMELRLGREIPTGSWLDVLWTIPYLVAAFWGARWNPDPGFYPPAAQEKSVTSMLFDNTLFALAPLVVLLQAAELGPNWRRLSFSFLGVSILCFVGRLSWSQFREFRSTMAANKANSERQEAESKFRTAFEANPESITISTLEDGIYVEVNNRFVALVEYNRSELIGKSALELGVWVDKQDRVSFADRLRRGEGISEWEVRFRTKSGKERQLMVSAHPVQVQGQNCILSILRDVTEQRLLERRFQQAQKMEAVGRLAGGVAHDFNNLLMITSANVELLLKANQNSERVQHYAGQIQTATERGAVLTRRLLAFSRQQVLQPTVLNLNTVITDLWKMLPRLLGEDIETILLLHPALGDVRADRGQLEQVLMNLAVNARDAMPHGGKLTVETSNIDIIASSPSTEKMEIPSGPCVLLSVSDTGVGMSPAVLAQIFVPFFTTKELGKGTGLGLATVYGIVKQSGGAVLAESELGKGSKFKVYFPRAHSKVPEVARQLTNLIPNGSGTILLVEDEGPLRKAISEYLQTHGYRVFEAGTAESALEICRTHTGSIDLLVTDIVMPGTGGHEVAKNAQKIRPGLATIFMSGYADRTLGSDSLGAKSAFLQKPVNLDVLARKIYAMLHAQ